MSIRSGVLDAIGNTPLIRLKRASEATGCEILGKAEFMNPGQSVKDRAALSIIRDAEAAGPAAARRRRSSRAPPATPASASRWSATRSATAPSSSSPRRRARRRRTCCGCCGAELRRGAGRALRQPEQLREAIRAAWPRSSTPTEPNGAIWANQFDNVANREAHYRDHRPGDLGPDRRQGRRLHLRGRHRRHAGRRRAWRCKAAQPGRQDRPRRPAWARRSTAATRTAS